MKILSLVLSVVLIENLTAYSDDPSQAEDGLGQPRDERSLQFEEFEAFEDLVYSFGDVNCIFSGFGNASAVDEIACTYVIEAPSSSEVSTSVTAGSDCINTLSPPDYLSASASKVSDTAVVSSIQFGTGWVIPVPAIPGEVALFEMCLKTILEDFDLEMNFVRTPISLGFKYDGSFSVSVGITDADLVGPGFGSNSTFAPIAYRCNPDFTDNNDLLELGDIFCTCIVPDENFEDVKIGEALTYDLTQDPAAAPIEPTPGQAPAPVLAPALAPTSSPVVIPDMYYQISSGTCSSEGYRSIYRRNECIGAMESFNKTMGEGRIITDTADASTVVTVDGCSFANDSQGSSNVNLFLFPSGTCDVPSRKLVFNVDPPTCCPPGANLMPYDSCTKYYQCIYGSMTADGIQTCPPGTLFDTTTSNCNWIYNGATCNDPNQCDYDDDIYFNSYIDDWSYNNNLGNSNDFPGSSSSDSDESCVPQDIYMPEDYYNTGQTRTFTLPAVINNVQQIQGRLRCLFETAHYTSGDFILMDAADNELAKLNIHCGGNHGTDVTKKSEVFDDPVMGVAKVQMKSSWNPGYNSELKAICDDVVNSINPLPSSSPTVSFSAPPPPSTSPTSSPTSSPTVSCKCTQDNPCFCQRTCIICDNRAPDFMISNGNTCTTAPAVVFQSRCRKELRWRQNTYCQLTCYTKGMGYAGDVCCNSAGPNMEIASLISDGVPNAQTIVLPGVVDEAPNEVISESQVTRGIMICTRMPANFYKTATPVVADGEVTMVSARRLLRSKVSLSRNLQDDDDPTGPFGVMVGLKPIQGNSGNAIWNNYSEINRTILLLILCTLYYLD